jgi:hypothetical protein
MRQSRTVPLHLAAAALTAVAVVAGTARPAAADDRPVAAHLRDTPPLAEVDVAGVGLPSTITLSARAAGVTAFGWTVDGGAETRVPAVDRAGTGTIVFTGKGTRTVTAHSYAGDRVAATQTLSVQVSDAPRVTSERFTADSRVVAGQSGTFVLAPASPGVRSFRYDFGDGEQRTAEADARGFAVLRWAPPRGGHHTLTVAAVTGGGAVSDPAEYDFPVLDPRPYAWSDAEANGPDATGVGLPVRVSMRSDLTGVRGFVYTFDGGPERKTGDGSSSHAEVVPDRAGKLLFVVRARLADGSLSPATTLPIMVTSAPVVEVEGPYGPRPITGLDATFTVRPGSPDVTGYRYTGPDGEERTVAAAADGTATLTWSPDETDETLLIAGVSADGTVSEQRRYDYSADDSRVSVSGTWSEETGSGGLGVPGVIGFGRSGAIPTVRFLWRIGDGPVRSADAAPDEDVTYVPYTPDRVGEFTLQVQQEFPDGTLSPVTEQRLIAGSAPLVEGDDQARSAGVARTFRLSGGLEDATAFDYRVLNQRTGAEVASGSVDAGEGGVADLELIPEAAGYYQLIVVARTAGGVSGDETRTWLDVK